MDPAIGSSQPGASCQLGALQLGAAMPGETVEEVMGSLLGAITQPGAMQLGATLLPSPPRRPIEAELSARSRTPVTLEGRTL